MRLNLNCFAAARPARIAAAAEEQHEKKQPELIVSSSPTKQLPPPPPLPPSPCLLVECASSPIHVVQKQQQQQQQQMRRLELPPPRDNMRVNRMGLRDKMRDLGDILHSLDSKQPASLLGRPSSGGAEVYYRRNWLESDFPAIKDNIMTASSPRPSSSLRSTPRSSINFGSSGAAAAGLSSSLQLGRLEAMLRSSSAADDNKDVLARLARIENKVKKAHEEDNHVVVVDKNNNKAMATFYESMNNFASRVEEHLKRSDVALRKVERKVQRLSSVRKKGAGLLPTTSRTVLHCSNCTPTKALVTCDDDKVTSLEHKLTATRAEVDRLLATTDELRKKSEENHVDVKLCWSALNQLCIDNESFRRELHQHRSCLQRVAQLVD